MTVELSKEFREEIREELNRLMWRISERVPNNNFNDIRRYLHQAIEEV